MLKMQVFIQMLFYQKYWRKFAVRGENISTVDRSHQIRLFGAMDPGTDWEKGKQHLMQMLCCEVSNVFKDQHLTTIFKTI